MHKIRTTPARWTRLMLSVLLLCFVCACSSGSSDSSDGHVGADLTASDATTDLPTPDSTLLNDLDSTSVGQDLLDSSVEEVSSPDSGADVPQQDQTPSDVQSGLNLQLTPSRTSGVAPLLVFFDTKGTSAPGGVDSFHELGYSWSFGDPGDKWTSSQLDRNLAHGPLAAHVFQKPGSYTVSVTVKSATGAEATRSVTINVADPDSTFSGTKTVCISQSITFDGCPSGALQVTTSDFGEIQDHIRTGQRILLRRTESWTASSALNIDLPGPGTLGAFGTGARPKIASTTSSIINLSSRTPKLSDWRIVDLELTMNRANEGVQASGTTSQILMLRLKISECISCIMFSPSILTYWNNNGYPGHTLWDQIGIVDCELSGTPNYLVYIGARRLAVMGNNMSDARGKEHVIRTPQLVDSLIAHNRMTDPAASKHIIKLHAPNWTEKQEYSERVLIAHNTFIGTADVPWPIALSPQSSGADERIRDIIFDGNFVLAHGDTQVGVIVNAQRVTVRNNVFNMSSPGNRTAVRVTVRGIEPEPVGARVYHNTAYRNDSGKLTLVSIDKGDVTARNNLLVTSDGSLFSGTLNLVTESHNLLTTTPGFSKTPPADLLDFQISAASPANDTGTQVPVFFDILGLPRSPQADLGAFDL